ncbi:MAG: type II toxin-antitoxin system RelE/ParE family toxin [Proteobacteria bacterium]|nr:type II toxin-antitoxin system RelE/ParE family toxin [Pseudomonadota bacterium]
MTFHLQWTERGLQEFQTALDFIAADDPVNAQLVRDRTFRTISNLRAFSLGLPAPHGTQKIHVPKTSYFLVFRRDKKDAITICGFVHASRDWDRIDWESI